MCARVNTSCPDTASLCASNGPLCPWTERLPAHYVRTAFCCSYRRPLLSTANFAMTFSNFLLLLPLFPTAVYSWQHSVLQPGSLQCNRGGHGAERRRRPGGGTAVLFLYYCVLYRLLILRTTVCNLVEAERAVNMNSMLTAVRSDAPTSMALVRLRFNCGLSVVIPLRLLLSGMHTANILGLLYCKKMVMLETCGMVYMV